MHWNPTLAQAFHPKWPQRLQDGTMELLLLYYCAPWEKLSAQKRVEAATCDVLLRILSSVVNIMKCPKSSKILSFSVIYYRRKKKKGNKLPETRIRQSRVRRRGKKKKAGSMQGLFAYSYETVLHFLLITLTRFSWLSSSICVTSV